MSSNLADYFRSQAEWRDAKAEQYPEDERNAQSAAALRSLADYVGPIDSREAESPSGDRYISFVDQLEPHLHDGTLGGALTRREVARYGYGHPVGSHKQFLEDLLLVCYEDAYAHAVERDGDDLTGTLHPFEVAAARDGIHMRPGYWRRRDRATVAELERWVREAHPADQEGSE